MKANVLYIIALILLFACHPNKKPAYVFYGAVSAGNENRGHNYILLASPDSAGTVTHISTREIKPADLVRFAESLEGAPYKYASTNPEEGFDCSGFIAYVFNHFDIAVPRSSVAFTHVRHQIELKDAKPGDLILFTGLDSTTRIVGHMGIVLSSPGEPVRFIHSSSGKAMGVTETPFEGYYLPRYIKTIRVFPQNDR